MTGSDSVSGKRFHVADGFADRAGPERNHRNAAAIAAFHGRAHQVRLREVAAQLYDIVFSPVVACPVETPHVVRLRFLVRQAGVEFVLLLDDAIDVKVLRAGVLVFRAREQEVGKVVVDFDLQAFAECWKRRILRLRRNFHTLAPAQLAGAVLNLGRAEVQSELNRLAVLHQNVAAARARLVQRELLIALEQRCLNVSRRQYLELGRTRGQDNRPARLHFHFDLRGLRRRSFGLRRWTAAAQAQEQQCREQARMLPIVDGPEPSFPRIPAFIVLPCPPLNCLNIFSAFR